MEKYAWRRDWRSQGDSAHFCKIDSPFIANSAIKWTASDQSNKYPVDIISTIHEIFYVDDYLDYFSSEDRTIDTIQKFIPILSNGGFTK